MRSGTPASARGVHPIPPGKGRRQVLSLLSASSACAAPPIRRGGVLRAEARVACALRTYTRGLGGWGERDADLLSVSCTPSKKQCLYSETDHSHIGRKDKCCACNVITMAVPHTNMKQHWCLGSNFTQSFLRNHFDFVFIFIVTETNGVIIKGCAILKAWILWCI